MTENASKQYAVTMRVLALLDMTTMMIFATIESQSVSPAFHSSTGTKLQLFTVASIFEPAAHIHVKMRHDR